MTGVCSTFWGPGSDYKYRTFGGHVLPVRGAPLRSAAPGELELGRVGGRKGRYRENPSLTASVRGMGVPLLDVYFVFI